MKKQTMPLDSKPSTEIRRYQKTRVEFSRLGKGPPLVLLHGEDAYELDLGLVEKLSEKFEVFVPRMPGFGKSSLPETIRTIDDVSYIWLDLLDDLDLRDVTLVGFSVGAWLAMEMASKNNDRLKRLVLAGAVGAKFGGKYDRDIEDIYFHPADRVRAMRFHDPALDPHADMTGLSKAEALAVARGREAITLICWDPYMHNPALKHRLNRVTPPTRVIWGAKDGMTSPKYGRKLSRHLPNADFVSLPHAGHFPHIEQPELFWQALYEFISD